MEQRWFVGKPSDRGQAFCPLSLLSKLPSIVDKRLQEPLKDSFYRDGAFWRNVWTIYYVWPPESSPRGGRPLLLVSEGEAQLFIGKIIEFICETNYKGQGKLRLPLLDPSFLNRQEAVMKFDYPHARLRPRYLGRSDSRQKYNDLSRSVPRSNWRPWNDPEGVGEPDKKLLESFGAYMEKAPDYIEAQTSTKYERSVRSQLEQQKAATNLVHLERFLGLGAPPYKPPQPQAGADLQRQSQEDEKTRLRSVYLPPINTTEPAPYPCRSDVVFVCFDLEAYELAKSKITEIGISILDTRDLQGVAPGANAKGWFPLIRSYHFRVKEYSHLENSKFVRGCAGDFRHGESELISLADAPSIVASCFRAPFVPSTHLDRAVGNTGKDRVQTHELQTGIHNTDTQDQTNITNEGVAHKDKRTIVLVGHDLKNDIRFLRQIGYDISGLTNLHPHSPTMDTQQLYGVVTDKQQTAMHQDSGLSAQQNPSSTVQPPPHPQRQASLSTILYAYDIPATGLHNAGNDAALTLRVLLAMAVKQASERECNMVELQYRLNLVMGVSTADGSPLVKPPSELLEGRW